MSQALTTDGRAAAGADHDGASRLRADDVMTTWLLVVEADDDCSTAWQAMGGSGAHHLPVLEAGRLVAVLSEGDLAADQVAWSLAGRRRRVRDLPVRPPVQVRPDAPLSVVARAMSAGGTDAVVVAGEDGELLGLVTARDLVEALAGPRRLRRGGTSALAGPAVVLRVSPHRGSVPHR